MSGRTSDTSRRPSALAAWLRRLRTGSRPAQPSGQVLFTARGTRLSAVDRMRSANDGARDAQVVAARPPPPPPAPTAPAGERSEDTTSRKEPAVRVHQARLDRRVGPLELSPSEAVRLADQGPRGLARRALPADEATARPPGRDAPPDPPPGGDVAR